MFTKPLPLETFVLLRRSHTYTGPHRHNLKDFSKPTYNSMLDLHTWVIPPPETLVEIIRIREAF